MKSLLPILLFGFLAFNVQCQTVITNSVLPQIGDSLYFAVDTTYSSDEFRKSGPNQQWNFQNVSMNGSQSLVYRPVSEGINAASFPSASAMVRQGINEQYFKFYLDRIELLGTGTLGGGPIPGIGGANVFPKPVTIQRFPESYRDTLSYTTKNSIALSSAILPDSILNLLPLKPDSFRILFSVRFEKEADGWGTLELPNKSWNVLREKRITSNQTSVEAKVPILGWIDVTALVSGIFGNFFGTINTVSYAFISNETKGLIAEINVDTLDNPVRLLYKPDDKTFTSTDNFDSASDFSVFPNPCSEQLYLKLNNAKDKVNFYQIQMIDGRTISSGYIEVNNNDPAEIKVQDLNPGMYQILLYSKNGNRKAALPFIKD